MDDMVKDQLDQMSEMLKATDEPSVQVPEEEPPEPEPEPKPEKLDDPEPEKDPEPEPDPDPDSDKDEEPKEPKEIPPEPEPEPTIDLETLQKDNAELRKRIDKMSAPEPEPEPEPVKPEPPEPDPITLDEVDFIGETDMDELTRDPKEFNKLLNKIYVQGVNASREHIGEGVLRNIPEIVKNNVTTVIALRKASDDFYENNKDLKPFKKVVSSVFEEMFAESPDKKYNEILTDVGTEVRNRLELHLKAVKPEPDPEPEPDPNNPPKLPRKKGQQRKSSPKPNPNPMLAEIDEMNKSL